jgi:hypothetical protein
MAWAITLLKSKDFDDASWEEGVASPSDDFTLNLSVVCIRNPLEGVEDDGFVKIGATACVKHRDISQYVVCNKFWESFYFVLNGLCKTYGLLRFYRDDPLAKVYNTALVRLTGWFVVDLTFEEKASRSSNGFHYQQIRPTTTNSQAFDPAPLF